MANILLLGDALVDKYIFGSVNRQSPEDPTVSVVDVEEEDIRLGGCLNVATNLKSLSDNSVWVASCYSGFIMDFLSQKRISTVYLNMGTYDTRNGISKNDLVKTRIFDMRSNKQLLRLDNHLTYDKEEIKFYTKYLQDLILNYDCLVISDYNKGLINDKTIETLSKFKGPVFVDTKKKDLSIWDKFENCIIKVNKKEWDASNQKSKHKIVVTTGDKGAQLIEDQAIDFPTERVENADVTGCGDVFLAALVTKHLESKSLPRAIIYANKMAAKSASFFGTTEVHNE
jgi:rfaE bifunctional protein kinase chain/domain